MSSKKTPNLGLHEWVPDDYVLMEEFNDNFKTLDDHVAELKSDITQIDQTVTQNHNEVMSHLAQKANKSDVRESTVIKPINVSEMDTETKQLFTGGAVAVVGADAVGAENIKKESVTPEKIRGFIPSKNLFNPSEVVSGLISTTSGNLYESVGHMTSPFKGIETATSFSTNTGILMAFYNADQTFISAVDYRSVSEWSNYPVPEGASLYRMSIPNAKLNKLMLIEGTEQIDYTPFVSYVDSFASLSIDDVTTPDTSLVYSSGLLTQVTETTNGQTTKLTTINYSSDGDVLSVVEENKITGLTKQTTMNYVDGELVGAESIFI